LALIAFPNAAVAQDVQPDKPTQPAKRRQAAQPKQPAPKKLPPGVTPEEAARARTESRVDTVQEALKNIDPSLITFTGAELDYEVVGDQIIVYGQPQDIQIVELLVALLDKTTEKKELRVVTVTEKDANDIARAIEQPLKDVFFEPNRRPELELSVTALSSNVLLVSALPNELEFIIDVIHRVDELKDELPEPEQLVFPVKNRRASVVAEELTEIITKLREKQGATGAKGEFQIIPNDANNSIMVLAPETEREKIQALLNEIDVEPVKGWGEVKLVLFPLLHSKANEMADVIEELLKSDTGREEAEEAISRLQISKADPTTGEIIDLPAIDLERPTRILADEGTNSLIIATVEANVGPMTELIRLMDGVPLGEDAHVRFFALRFADAESVGETIDEMFDKGKELPEDPDGSGAESVPDGPVGKAFAYKIGVSTDIRTNTLIVSGREEQLRLVDTVVAELDRPATALKFPLRFIELEFTDASKVAKIIQDLFDQRLEALEATDAGRAALERERIFLSVDLRTNSLILSASEENHQDVLRLARQLDTKPAKLFDQIRIVRCERLSANDIKQKIEELWERKAQLRAEEELLEDTPVVVVDDRSNALIIASSIEDYEEIKELVRTLESQPVIEDTSLYKLEYADAAVLADMLDELFQGMAGDSESFTAPTIMPDPRSNALVVAGSRDALERTAGLVQRLDVKVGPMTAIFKVYPLEYASAVQLAERMQELFDSRDEGSEITRTPIVILADEASNSLVSSASRDDHEAITELLSLLDRPSSIARQFQIFPLQRAKANSVAEKLESVFQSQADSGGGRADAIATEADERTNSIVVWAAPSQMENIEQVIARLDTATPAVETMVKVVQLKQALAEDFADLLRRTVVGEEAGNDDERAVIVSFIEKSDDGSETLRKLLRQDITVEADPRTNSLMVMAPVDSMAMLESMIRDFDTIRPIRSEIRLFPLINSDSESMVDQLTELFEAETADGEAKSQLVFGDTIGEFEVSSVGQDLRFAADTRTNTLIAAGAEVDLRMVEELVRYLDSQEAEDRVVQVMQTKYMEPDQIASAIQGFNQQEQDVLGEIDDQEARLRRMERQISVEAVGSEEQGGRSLIIGTSRQSYLDTMAMIQELDRPEPQVMISVLIAEVRLQDDFDLGVELAGQDLRFSENAIVGPNGLVQGADFDFVGGTGFGVGSGLGFSFSIAGEDFSFLVNALQGESRLEVLSRPILLVRNGEEGNITIADEIPFVESSQVTESGSTNTVIGREDVGIVLTATPHISPDGYVTVEMSQEISSFGGENFQITEGVSQPVFNTSEVQTNVTLRDGETVVIGGLITSRHSEGHNKVPLIGDIPLIGHLFRATGISEQKTELLIVMTVDILRTDQDARHMSIEQRDKFVLPDSIRSSALMEGLRITAEEQGMGPVDRNGRAPGAIDPTSTPDREERRLYGPTPKSYGPVISRPKPTTTTSRPVYGPKIVQTDGNAKAAVPID
jgi:type II secretion system protein D